MDEPEQRSLLHRLGWMALIWFASITVLGIVASVIRFWLKV